VIYRPPLTAPRCISWRARAPPGSGGGGLHSHKYALDAFLCATALAQPGRVTILTSDIEDIAGLTADHLHVTVDRSDGCCWGTTSHVRVLSAGRP
jgi:hypothetical protein